MSVIDKFSIDGVEYDFIDSTARSTANAAVPQTRKVNNKALSSDITLTPGDIGYDESATYTSGTLGAKVAAEAAETSELKTAINTMILPVTFAPGITRKSYISSSTGKPASANAYARTTGLWWSAGYKIAIRLTNPNFTFSLAFYDSTGTISTGVGFIESSSFASDIVYIPANAVKFGITFHKIDNTEFSTSDADAVLASLVAYAPTDMKLETLGIAADAKTVGDIINNGLGYAEYSYTSGKYIPLGDRNTTTNGTQANYNNTGSYFIPCTAGDTFEITADAWSASAYRLYGFLSEAVNGVYTILQSSNATAARSMRVVAPTGAEFLAVNVKTNTSTAPNVVKGGSVDNRIDNVKAEISVPLGYKDNITYDCPLISGSGVNGENGEIGTDSAYSYTDYVELDTSKYDTVQYSRVTASTAVTYGGMAFYDANKNYISGIGAFRTSTPGHMDNTVKIPVFAKYARFTCRNASIDSFQIVLINSGVLQKELNKFGPDTASAMTFCPDGLYVNDDVQTAIFATANDVYTAYDTLFASHIEVTKNLVGYGSDSSGNADTNLPIYEYVIPNPVTGGQITPAVKMLLTSGMHGDEPLAVTGLYNFIRSLYDTENEIADFIKCIGTFVIVPVCNPGGFNNRSRTNNHGVDINRNFSTNWGVAEDRGTAVYSEVETQALCTWLALNIDALFMVDFHNHNLLEQGSTTIMYYTATEVPMHRIAWSFGFRSMIKYMIDKFDTDISTYNHVFEGNTIPGFAAEAYNVYKIDASIFETPGGTSAAYAQKTSAMTGNFVLSLLKNYRV